jgi:TolB-like protein
MIRVVLVVCLAASAARADDDVVAVMPFRNLNADAALAWLEQGIAETMLSDLKKLGRPVVERAALDRALAEIALGEGGGTTEATAARAGKLVGARTVVVGGFQKAGDDLRITARFVAVETGVVLGSAKATGRIERVFELQDEITAALAGGKSKPARARKPKPGREVVDAYRAYALSLQTSSEAERVQRLREAIAFDPDFSYAVDDLRALEARMRGYARADRAERDRVHDETRRLLAAADLSPTDRAQQAMLLLSSDMTSMRWRKVLDDCAAIEDVGVPPLGPTTFDELCSHYRFVAYQQLKRTDDALKQGERHLARFPGSATFGIVKTSMQAEIDRRRRRALSMQELDAELAALEADRAKARTARGRDPVEVDRQTDWRRCAESYSHADYARALDECARYLQAHGDGPNPHDANELARFYMMMARYERGEFDRARAEAERLLDEHPAFAEKMSLAMMTSTWPRD